ncbi:hypothetical protein AVEN_264718-1 [Araneus ventricosus]|uniref:Uncharacterized protein n=1 Tax=Araneus ventricosus TaxID=182803 RepID=A0A4Y2RBE2_ARAVE|nr:hypothetical protein AVEN_264718-1 [Araneus ventricosus]
MGHVMNLFCETSSFQHWKGADVWIPQFLYKMEIPLHISIPVNELLNLHFGNDRIISRHFKTAWPPTSPDLNTTSVCGLPKRFCLRGPSANLAELKNRVFDEKSSNSRFVAKFVNSVILNMQNIV